MNLKLYEPIKMLMAMKFKNKKNNYSIKIKNK